MPKSRSGKGKRLSMWSGLPQSLKTALRSQPRLEGVTTATIVSETPTARFLPTQPPDDAEEAEEVVEAEEAVEVVEGDSSMDMDMDDDGDDSDKENVQPKTTAPSQSPKSSASGSVVLSRRIDNRPYNRMADELDSDESGNPWSGHPWDCTGLVPRYTSASQLPKDLQKYWWQRHSLFTSFDRLPLLLDETGWFSVTPSAIAQHIAERCRCDVILDAFCGLGGNAIAFARTCERVIAMDIDETRLKLARHNALQQGVADRIEFVLGDYIQWARKYGEGRVGREEIDVVFLSPPWGGPSYNMTEVFPLSAVEPIPGDELFRLSSRLSPNIAYYLPRQTDVSEVAALAEPLEAPENDSVDGKRQREKEWVEIEEEWVGDKCKAITAYYGALVAGA